MLSQQLESPAIPILRTILEYSCARMALTTFATNDGAEGRVDNVLLGISADIDETMNVEPLIEFDTVEKFDLEVIGRQLDRASPQLASSSLGRQRIREINP